MIVVVMGVCGCGKSSTGRRLADHMACDFIEGDAFHPPENRAKMAAGTPLTDADRWPWLDRLAEAMARHHGAGASAVLACSALRQSYRDRLRASGTDPVFVHLTGDPEVIRARMAARTDHFMPPGLLDSQLATLEPAGEGETLHAFDVAGTGEAVAREIIARLSLPRGRPTPPIAPPDP